MNAVLMDNLRDSSADFCEFVWPVIKSYIGDGRIDPVEAVTNESTTRNLDMLAGIDAWQYLTCGMRGIASRIQWLYPDNSYLERYWPWNTFTVRQRTASGCDTEYQKRLKAIESKRGLLYPHLTVQAYIYRKRHGPLDAVAVVETAELIDYIRRYNPPLKTGKDGHQFYIPRWSHMVDVGYEVIMSSRYEPTVLDHHPCRIQ